MKFPTIQLKELQHLGTLSAEDKKTDSHEGAGLSVTTHLKSWIQIAKGHLSGVPHRVRKENNQFLHFHKLTKKQKEHILQWGVDREYIIPSVLYEVTYFDDEMNCHLSSLYTNYDEAVYDAEYYEAIAKEKNGYLSTTIMQEKVCGKTHPVMVLDLLSTLFAEEELNIDGVWWQDKLDVYSFSAPRGVIVPSKVHEWTFTEDSSILK